MASARNLLTLKAVAAADDSNDSGQHYVSMKEAVMLAHVAMYGRPPASEMERNGMADTLARVSNLYVASGDGGTVRPLSGDDVLGSFFTGGGRFLTFSDGRPALDGIVLRRASLDAAIAALKRTRS